VELFTPSHTDTKSTLPLPLCHKSQMLSQTVQLALSGSAKGGQPGQVPRSGCAPAVGWPLGGRDSSSQLTKLSQMLQMLGSGGCVLLQMSPLILPRQSCPVSV